MGPAQCLSKQGNYQFLELQLNTYLAQLTFASKLQLPQIGGMYVHVDLISSLPMFRTYSNVVVT